MLTHTKAFSSFSVDDLEKAKAFYSEALGLKVNQTPEGLNVEIMSGPNLFLYPKPDHAPATFTVLNFLVSDIDKCVDDLTSLGVKFEHYDQGQMKTDSKGIARSTATEDGPTIAWFKDPAGNFLSIIQGEKNG